MLALGVPLFDTILAPVRRFIRGKKMFSPDNGHIHHKLKEMGLTTNRVVWILYTISCGLCILAVIVVNLRDERAGLVLIVLGVGAVFFVRKLGYFEYFASDKIYGWFKDITDVAGFSHERRSFLNVQMDLGCSNDFEGVWGNVVRGMEMLGFDAGEMVLWRMEGRGRKTEDGRQRKEFREQRSVDKDPKTLGFPDRPKGTVGRGINPPVFGIAENVTNKAGSECQCEKGEVVKRSTDCLKEQEESLVHEYTWTRVGFGIEKNICDECLLKIELPLLKEGGEFLGTLWLVKDLKREPVTHYTLRRIEHLRRTLISTIIKLQSPPEKK